MTRTECAACADERAAGATFCEVCGNSLCGSPLSADAPPATVVAAQPSPVAVAGTCAHCGAADAVGADGYCEQCGMLAARQRDHLEIDAGEIAAAVTDRGLRHHRNEDAMWLVTRGKDVDVVVCDGVSASFDPDVASEIAAAAAGTSLASGSGSGSGESADIIAGSDSATDAQSGLTLAAVKHVSRAIDSAVTAVAALADTGDPRRAASNPACTIVAATIRGTCVAYGWVGDSRAYWLPAAGDLQQLTVDDSWATHAIALGADPQSAMRDPKAHAITAWLGADAGPVTPQTGAFIVTEPGHLVLCTDGLWNYLTNPTAFASTARVCLQDTTLINAARALTDFAVAAGGADNITVALIAVNPSKE